MLSNIYIIYIIWNIISVEIQYRLYLGCDKEIELIKKNLISNNWKIQQAIWYLGSYALFLYLSLTGQIHSSYTIQNSLFFSFEFESMKYQG